MKIQTPLNTNFNASQKHESTLLLHSPYACTEPIFDSRKLVNYARHSGTLNFRNNSKSSTFFFENSDLIIFKHFSKTHFASINLDTKGAKKEV